MTPRANKSSYVLADIEPTIAIAEAARWERETAVPTPTPKPMAYDLMKKARLARSEYQRELLRHFAEMIVSWLYSPRASQAPAKAPGRVGR